VKKILLLLILLTISLNTIHSQPIKNITISGYVFDKTTGEAIKDAVVIAYGTYYRDIYVTLTDSHGFYNLSVTPGQTYRIYAYTRELNYVPIFTVTKELMEDVRNMNFSLLPGATVELQGNFYNFYIDRPADFIGMEIVESEIPLQAEAKGGNITRFGNYPASVGAIMKILNISYNHAIIPARQKVKLKITGVWRIVYKERFEIISQNISITLKLDAGAKYVVDLSRETLGIALEEAALFVNKTAGMLNTAETKGFYLVMERKDLDRAIQALNNAKVDYKEGRYISTLVGLLEIRTTCENIINIINESYNEAYSSVPLIITLIAFAATAISLYISEKKSIQTTIYLILLALFLISVYLTYPGFRLYPMLWLIVLIISTSLLIFGLSQIAPSIIKEKPTPRGIAFWSALVVMFSSAKRNLRRRRLQSTLTIISMTVMVWAFITLTSYASLKGVVTYKQPYPASYDGVLVKNIGLVRIDEATFRMPMAIANEHLDIIQSHLGVRAYYLRYSSFLVSSYIGILKHGRLKQEIYGILALSTSEAEIIGLTKITNGKIPEKSGEVALPSILAEDLNVSLGDYVELLNRTFKVVGIISSDDLYKLRDLDGRTIHPYKLYTYETEKGPAQTITPVSNEELVIISLDDAQSFKLIPISVLVDVEKEYMEQLIEKLALMRLKIWYNIYGVVYKAEYGTIIEVKGGFYTIIPMTIVMLTIFITFVSSVYQRKMEVMTLSSIGVNPTYITLLFTIEAIISGIIAGGVGYLAGISSYKLFSLLGIGLEVRQKVSATWGIISLLTAIVIAVLGSIYPAYKSTFIVIPSMLRRFKLESKRTAGTYNVPIPLKIPEGLIKDFIKFANKRFKEYRGAEVISDVLTTEEEVSIEGKIRRIIFSYEYPDGMIRAKTINEVTLMLPTREKFWSIVLKCTPVRCSFPEEAVYRTTKVLRKIILEWSSRMKLKEEGETY